MAWRSWAVLVALVWSGAVSAFYIELHGVVTDYFTGDPVKGVKVRVVKDGVERETVLTESNGKYSFILDRGYEYLVWFSQDRHVTKHVRIDTREVPPIPDVPYFDMFLQMTVFPWVDGVDLSVFDRPVAEAAYRHSIRNLTWDTEYTESVRKDLARTMTTYERTFGKRTRDGKAGSKDAPQEPRPKRKRVDF